MSTAFDDPGLLTYFTTISYIFSLQQEREVDFSIGAWKNKNVQTNTPPQTLPKKPNNHHGASTGARILSLIQMKAKDSLNFRLGI